MNAVKPQSRMKGRAMKYLILTLISATMIAPVLFAQEDDMIKDETDRINYSLGYQIGGDFKRQGVEIRPELVVKGVEDALSGAGPMMTPEEMNRTLVELQRKIVADQQAALKREADDNLAKATSFLLENKNREGVVTLPSGLQYRVVRDGTGASPGPADKVTVHYKGTLIDGTEFDSSYGRGQPAVFQANQVIAGWNEALQLMKAGAKWELFLPPALAYGNRGVGDKIEPNSALIFEVELLSVEKNPGKDSE
jgi:FKBP-type peptidyl-prolyl cis-trans isomerase FklB